MEIQALAERLHELQEESFNRPGDSSLRQEMGEMALLMLQPELARAWFQAAVGLDPRNQSARDSQVSGSPKYSGQGRRLCHTRYGSHFYHGDQW